MNVIIFVVMLLAGLVGGGEVRAVEKVCKTCGTCQCEYVDIDAECIDQVCVGVVCSDSGGGCVDVGEENGGTGCEANMEENDLGVCVCSWGYADCDNDNSNGCESDVACDQCVESGGDYNGDGNFDVVNDLIGWYTSYRGGGDMRADFDCSGEVDVLDLIEWYGNYRGNVVPTLTLVPTATLTSMPVLTSTPVPTLTPIPTPTPTTSPLRSACEDSGGSWVEYSDGCLDKCSKVIDPGIGCTTATAYGCDCGVTKCWDTRTNACILNPMARSTPTGALTE